MSYVVSIKRPEGEPPLTRDDFKHLLDIDGSLKQTNDGRLVWNQTETRLPLFINIETDHLWTGGVTENASDLYLEKLRGIAHKLDARVVGEEGEDITERSGDGELDPLPKPAGLGGLLLGATMLPVLLLTILVRLPWLIWKLAKTLK